MKAYMSDRKARAEYLYAYGPASGLNEYEQREEHMKEALAEARRILAETEGDEPASQHLSLAELCKGPEPYWLVPEGGSVTAREILRDGLRAWLGE